VNFSASRGETRRAHGKSWTAKEAPCPRSVVSGKSGPPGRGGGKVRGNYDRWRESHSEFKKRRTKVSGGGVSGRKGPLFSPLKRTGVFLTEESQEAEDRGSRAALRASGGIAENPSSQKRRLCKEAGKEAVAPGWGTAVL